MANIERLAAEVREDIGLFGPIEAKLLAVWLGLELVPMPYPCEGLVDDGHGPMAVYYAEAGECSAQRQIARTACIYMLIGVGIEFPAQAETQLLAALLCGDPVLVPIAV